MQLIKTLLVTTCCCLYLNVYAQNWEGDVSTDWFDGNNWDTGLVPTTGDTPFIPNVPSGPFFPEINSSLSADFPITNSGTLTINADLTMSNSMNLLNFSNGIVLINTSGLLENEVGSAVVNQGELQIEGAFFNVDNVDNDGNITIGNDALLNNGTDAYIRNDGTILNGNLIQNESNIDNFNTITNLGTFDNNGSLNLMQGSSFTNGLLAIFATLNNTGLLIVSGDFNNNVGQVNNQGSWTIQASGIVNNEDIISNESELNNSGLLVNNHEFINSGLIINQFGNSTIDNNASFLNEACQLILLLNTNDLDDITNHGIIDARSGAMVTTTSDSEGIVLENAGDVARPDAQCIPTLTATLDETGNLTLTPEQIDNGSTVDYCTIQELSLSTADFTCENIGEQFVTLTVLDDNDGSSFCQTLVTIIPPEPSAMVCNDEVHVSINASCDAVEITPDFLLMGNHYTCMESYEVRIEGLNDNIIPPHQIGELLTVSITEPFSGANCWGTIILEDETPPTFINCGVEEILCIQNPLPVGSGGDVPNPTFIDCPDVVIVYNDFVQNGDCNAGLVHTIDRVWTATDQSGNVSQCTQTINVRNVSLNTFAVTCPSDVTIECAVGESNTLDPDRTGFPYVSINNIDYELNPDSLALCGLMTTYTDDTIPRCGETYELYRHWTIMDWCVDFGSANSSFVCTQHITYQDNTPPVIQISDNININSQGFDCGAIITIPAADIQDCSDYDVVIVTPNGNIEGNGGLTPGAGLVGGENLISYEVTDICGNTATESFTITVEDTTPPVAVCSDVIHVSLSDEGFSAAFTPSFDEGSHDACGIERMEVERINPCNPNITTEPDQFVSFSCCDVADSPVMVRLRVFDFAGNANECMVGVIVEDNIPPTITCPPNKVLSCDSDYTNLSLTSEPLGNDNCSSFEFTYVDDLNISDCGIGTILRTWTATSDQNETVACVQTINLINDNPFNGEEDISWPFEYTASGCGAATDPDITGYPLINEGNCSNVLASYHDQVFNFVDDVCYKIIRTWTIVDWCQPGEEWQRAQIIKVIDEIPPILENCDDRTFCNTNQACSMTIDLPVTIADDCIDVEDLDVTWEVDAFNDGITDGGATHLGVGQHSNRTYPNGTHRITYEVADGCGNVTTCSFLFTIEDCKAPTPVCIHGLSVNLMETGMTMVAPHMLDAGSSFDNCSPQEDLSFSFSSTLTEVERFYTCDNLGYNAIELWVTDAAGNQAFCESFVHVQDNLEVCEEEELEGATVAGYIQTESGDMLEGVEVNINHDMPSVMTDLEGSFTFDALPMYQDYQIQPQKNTDPLNGVTTFDIILIKKHILAIQTLDTPYKMIAADVNRSGTITSFDLVEIRKLILHRVENFENNTAWRFIESSYEFLNSDNPLTDILPEQALLSDLEEHHLATDFIAIKIGDVNGSAIPNNLVPVEDRSERENLVFDLHNETVNIGEIKQLDLTAETISAVSGFQFSLQVLSDAVEIVEIIPSAAMSTANFGTSQLENGIITVSWDNVENKDVTTTLFSLVLKAKQAGQWSDWISLNASTTLAEAYTKDGEDLMNVSLNFETGTMLVMSDVVLYQNHPNPFGENTKVRFFLPQASTASLTILDVTGKVVHSISGHFMAGQHEFDVNAADMKTKGVYYYRLETGDHTATRKMVRQ